MSKVEEALPTLLQHAKACSLPQMGSMNDGDYTTPPRLGCIPPQIRQVPCGDIDLRTVDIAKLSRMMMFDLLRTRVFDDILPENDGLPADNAAQAMELMENNLKNRPGALELYVRMRYVH